jgi:phosphoribosylaminoimidazole-succinocarboxamide synthase
MISNSDLQAQLPLCLKATDFPTMGAKYEGKVRDNYSKDGKRVIIVTDRLSAFDRVITLIPFKGQVLNQMAKFWFDKTKDIAENLVIEFPDPNVVVA